MEKSKSLDKLSLKGDELKTLMAELGADWKLIDEHHIEKEYTFKNFADALEFTNDVGRAAEEEGHHPEIFLSWGKVKVKFYTHRVNGLLEKDFHLADKCDTCFESRFPSKKKSR